MFRLDGRIALVTGASRGIGRACAEALAQQGATVVVNYVRGEQAARDVADSIAAKGGKAEVIGFDVSDSKAVAAAVDEIAERHGKVDVLIANAGIVIDALLLRLRDEDLDRLWATNVRGPIACARAASKTMMRGRWGRIVFVSSIVGEMGNVGQTGYAATKAALIGAAKSIAREFGSRNITANVIAPGYIETGMGAAIDEGRRQAAIAVTPLGRTGTGADIAAACVYLASEEGGYVTGQVIRVNGGLYM
jgi:3-oxoacyl-[acyl-carrier protein] reductase